MQMLGDHLPVILIELVLVFGGVLAFAVWQLRSVARDRRQLATPPAAGIISPAPTIESPPMTALPHPRGDEPSGGIATPLLYHVAYCSRAAEGVGDAEVAAIVASAKRWNPAHGVTGMLVFGSGVFFQWLEGPRVAVQRLMTMLRTDPRHHDVVALSESEEERDRLFPDWDMELVGPDHIRDVLADALESAEDADSIQVLTQLLEQLDGTEGDLATLGHAGPAGSAAATPQA